MKHLKKFESATAAALVNNYFTQEDLDDIKDVLLDLMDEYNLLLTSSDSEVENEYIDLKFTDFNHNQTVDITKCLAIRVMIFSNSRKSNFRDDIINTINRFKQMGYKIVITDPFYFHICKQSITNEQQNITTRKRWTV